MTASSSASLEPRWNSVYGGEFKYGVYYNKVEYAEHLALVKGEISPDGPVLVRMHAFNVQDDVLGDRATEGGRHLQKSMR